MTTRERNTWVERFPRVVSVIVRIGNDKTIPGVIKQKVADRYFVAMTMFRESYRMGFEPTRQY